MEERGKAETEPTATLAGRYEILPGKPLPAFASPAAPAYAVRDTRETGRRLFALLCPKELPFREEPLATLRRMSRPQHLVPADWGVIDWPVDDPSHGVRKGRRPVIVFEMPGGERVMPSLSRPIQPMNEDVLIRQVVRPALTALKDLALVGLSHGAIRPDNLFYGGGPAGEIVLGESCSTPPGFSQPALLLTIEGGMANPGGRGSGGFADDIYALGVTLLILLLGRDPVSHLPDDAIIAEKIAHGSYAALAGQARIGTSMAELLRGLLADGVDHRWTFDQIGAWLDGRRLSPNPPNLPPRAGRPFRFDGAEYWTRPALAHAMAQRWDRAIGVVDEGMVEPWLRRSLGDDKRASRLTAAAAAVRAFGNAKLAGHVLLAWALMALDPAAPIRFRGFAARIDSLGMALAAGFDQPGAVQRFVEMIDSKIPQGWIELQADESADLMPVRKILDMLRHFLDKPGPGFSIERCLYELNPGMPCRSPILEEEYVTKLSDLLPALDRVASRTDHGREPIDRHVAAFIAARAKTSADGELDTLRPNVAEAERRLGIIRLLAIVDQDTGGGRFPVLAAWLAALAEPIVESFNHRPYRKALRREIGHFVERGQIVGFMTLLDNGNMRDRDREGFRRAQLQYAEMQSEVKWLEQDGLTARDRIQKTSRHAAAVTSAITAVLVLTGAITVMAL